MCRPTIVQLATMHRAISPRFLPLATARNMILISEHARPLDPPYTHPSPGVDATSRFEVNSARFRALERNSGHEGGGLDDAAHIPTSELLGARPLDM